MGKGTQIQWTGILIQEWQTFVRTDMSQTLRLRLEDNICLYIWTGQDPVALRRRWIWETLHAWLPN